MDSQQLEDGHAGQCQPVPVPEQAHLDPHALGSSTSSTNELNQPPIPSQVSDALKTKGLEVDNRGTVRWASTSVAHPRRWPLSRKLYDTAILCSLEFFMTLISNTGSSIASLAAGELGVSRETALLCFTTLYLMGQAIGSLIFPPLAESFGGRTIYLTSTLGYAMFCLAVAAWPILPVVVACRLVTGLLSAMPAVVAAGTLENMWDMTSRTFVIWIWTSSAVLGLAVGPAVATFVSLSPLGWRLCFCIAAAIMGALTLLCFRIRESRPSKLLRQHAKAIARSTGFDGFSFDGDDSMPTLRMFLTKSLFLPLRLFFTEPIVVLTSTMAASVYGIVYLFSECLDIVYVESYGLGQRQASLVLLALAIGVGLTFLPRLYDVRVARMCCRRATPLEPEHKLFGFYIAAPVLALGLWWFACTVPPLTHVSPLLSIASLILVGFSVVEFDNVLCGYLCDTYASYAGSANAGMSFLRCILSGVLPLFGDRLFRGLGTNMALFMLAGVATLYCAVAVLFGVYGKAIRKRSPCAETTWRVTSSKEELVGDAS